MKDDQIPRLHPDAEELLKNWPLPERDESAWDEAANKVIAKLDGVNIGSTDEALLCAPLPIEAADGLVGGRRPAAGLPDRQLEANGRVASPQPAAAPAPGSKSLAELARASVARKAADSAAEDLAKETLSLASRARPNVSAIAERVRQRTDSNAEIAGPAQAGRVAPAVPPASRPSQRSAAPARISRKGPIIGAFFAVAGMAAAVAILILRNPATAPQVTAATTPPVAAQAPAAPGAAAAPAAREEALSLNDLPKQAVEHAPAERSKSPAPPAAAPMPRTAPPAPLAKRAEPPPAAAPPPAPAPVERKDGPPPGMQVAVGPGTMPEQPSFGAVQAAIAGVLGNARACVAGQDASSSAVLVFGSDGRVQSVTVSGPAAGTPSEGCIRNALKQARVEPFAKPSFTVKTPPIRP